MSPKRYTADEVSELQRRFEEKSAELAAVLEEIAAKVQALDEELAQRDETSSALASGPPLGSEHRPARG